MGKNPPASSVVPNHNDFDLHRHSFIWPAFWIFSNVEKSIFWILTSRKTQWRHHQHILSSFWFLQIQTIHFFTFEYIKKLLAIKEYRFKSESMWVRKNVACWWIFFYHFPVGGEFLHRHSHFISSLRKSYHDQMSPATALKNFLSSSIWKSVALVQWMSKTVVEIPLTKRIQKIVHTLLGRSFYEEVQLVIQIQFHRTGMLLHAAFRVPDRLFVSSSKTETSGCSYPRLIDWFSCWI